VFREQIRTEWRFSELYIIQTFDAGIFLVVLLACAKAGKLFFQTFHDTLQSYYTTNFFKMVHVPAS